MGTATYWLRPRSLHSTKAEVLEVPRWIVTFMPKLWRCEVWRSKRIIIFCTAFNHDTRDIAEERLHIEVAFTRPETSNRARVSYEALTCLLSCICVFPMLRFITHPP